MSGAQEVTRALGGKWFGRYGMACCPAHEDRSPSLSLTDGDDGRLLLKCHAGCDFRAVEAALGGLPGPRGGDTRDAGEARARREAERRADELRRARQAQALWEATGPIQGSLAERYLRERGIYGPLPSSMRFLANCWHPSAKRVPAMICRVTGGDGFAVHRTYLANDGREKACLSPAKAMLGPTRGGAVRLSSGPRLVVTEGIETGLSLLSGLLPDRPSVWAALSAPGMAVLQLPRRPGKLTIAADGDPAGRDAANQLGHRAEGLGWRVLLLTAPEGQDWNDVLREQEGS